MDRLLTVRLKTTIRSHKARKMRRNKNMHNTRRYHQRRQRDLNTSQPRIIRETRHFHLDYSSGIKVMKDRSEVYNHSDRNFFHRSIHPRGSDPPSTDDVLIFSEFTRNIQFDDNSMYIETWTKHYGADGTMIYEHRSACLHDADGLLTSYDSDFFPLNIAQNDEWRDDPNR